MTSAREIALKLLLHAEDPELGFSNWSFEDMSEARLDKKSRQELERTEFETSKIPELPLFPKNSIIGSLQLGKLIGKISYLKTFISDSKKYPYWSIADEVEEEIKKVILESIEPSGYEMFRFVIASEEENSEDGVLVLEAMNISPKILDVLQKYEQKVEKQEAIVDNRHLLTVAIIEKIIEERSLDLKSFEKLLTEMIPYQVELSEIKEDTKYMDSLYQVLTKLEIK